MLTIFNRKKRNYDLSWMDTDMHSHLLPGIDDGCTDEAESMDLLGRLVDLKLQHFYFTPHIFQEMYPNTRERIEASFDQVKGKGFDKKLGGYAAEYMLDSNFEQLLRQPDPQFLVLPNNHILIEMSYIQENKQIEKLIFDLLIAGYYPILAHPERYIFYHTDMQKISRLREIGCLLQVNLLSIIGYYGTHEKRVAKYLAGAGLVDLVGTDAHHERHVKALEHGLQREDLKNYFKRCELLNPNLFDPSWTSG
ncbi:MULTISPECIES: tyrosine-protein phosphatase [Sphingobacterium]|uniref:tyrosine-protein phosphatase n=1 Tax=Sphingobacterium TaxID=28453 RepID=UPI00257C2212|nr:MULTISPECIES: CpsB/CapC family capsule biosynthesis tyrosine phosphatase [Sphingobacterium]